MLKKKRFRPTVTRVKLNPEQAVLTCSCWAIGYKMISGPLVSIPAGFSFLEVSMCSSGSGKPYTNVVVSGGVPGAIPNYCRPGSGPCGPYPSTYNTSVPVS